LEGCHRFLKRVWNLFQKADENSQKSEENKIILKKLNQTIKKVGEDLAGMKYNTAIAAMMELLNEFSNFKFLIFHEEHKKVLEKFLLILAPFAPHITEELWEKIGNKFSVHQQNWPEYDVNLIKEERATIAIQVNGKLRSTVEVPSAKVKDQSAVEETAKKDEKIKRYLGDKDIIKTIYVPGKLINFVVSS